MSQEVSAFLRAKSLNNATYPAQQTWNCVLGCLSQMRLQFAEGHLDRVEVGRIGGRTFGIGSGIAICPVVRAAYPKVSYKSGDAGPTFATVVA
jgi:hypothetical protein